MDILRDLIKRCYYAAWLAIFLVYFGDIMLTAYREGNTEKLLGYALVIVSAMLFGLVVAFAVTLFRYRKPKNRKEE